MKHYYASKKKLILVPIPSFILLSMAYVILTLDDVAKLLFSTIIFLTVMGTWYFFYRRLTLPILTIHNNQITITNLFLKETIFQDLNQLKLVLSNDFIAIREKNKQDVLISKDDISKNNWLNLVNELKKLPFKSQIK